MAFCSSKLILGFNGRFKKCSEHSNYLNASNVIGGGVPWNPLLASNKSHCLIPYFRLSGMIFSRNYLVTDRFIPQKRVAGRSLLC